MIPSFRDPAPPKETNPHASSVGRTGRALRSAIASEPDKCVRSRGECPGTRERLPARRQAGGRFSGRPARVV